MRCNGFIVTVIVLGTPASVGWNWEVPSRQAEQSTFEAEGMNHSALAAETPDGSADNSSDIARNTPPTTCEGTEVRPTPNLEAVIDVPGSSWRLHGGTYEEADELIEVPQQTSRFATSPASAFLSSYDSSSSTPRTTSGP
jgi:hypothetical protein